MTPSDLLRAYAQIAEQTPLTMESAGGPALQKAFVNFLSETAQGGKLAPALLDLIHLVARASISLNMAEHQGRPCTNCLHDLAICFARAMESEAREQLQSQNMKGAH